MKPIIFCSFFVFISLLWFFPSLAVFFVQDDFWLLSISKAETLTEFVAFFRPLNDAVWYRPLSSQLFFWFARIVFGMQPFYFHLLPIVAHGLTAYMLYKLVLLLHKPGPIAILSGFFYLVHQIHTVSISWLAAYSFILTPFFIVSAIYFFMKEKYKIALIIFVLALLSSETAIVVPVILTAHTLINNRKHNFALPVFWIPLVLLIFIRWILFPTSQSSVLYEMKVDLKLFSTLQFYLYRLIGIPLGFPLLDKGIQIFHLFAAAIFSFVLVVAVGIRMRLFRQYKPQDALFLEIACIGLMPFLLLANHLAPYYASISLLGIAPLLANSIFDSSQYAGRFSKIVLLVLVITFSLQQFSGHLWQYNSHWLFKRATLARQLVIESRFDHPVGTEEYFALGANRAKEVFEK